MIVLLYALFFLSGAAALVYEVAWVRSLSLVFGGSHLAVTTVLAVFMGGLALGGFAIGRRVERTARPLRLYGLLEIGIAVSAAAFLGVIEIYPSIYVPLARLTGGGDVPLSILRVCLAAAGMIVPTTLMGGTLPVLSRFVGGPGRSLGRHLSFLYGFNTLGAVVGVLAAGFALLPALGLRTTIAVAIATNGAIGLAALLIPEARLGSGREPEPADTAAATSGAPEEAGATRRPVDASAFRAVLWGIGVGGFCALGYEVLWTRVLSMVIGTSVYGFTVMLVAFLAGIAAGSAAFGLLYRWFGAGANAGGRAVAGFGAVEVAIGLTALVVTYALRDLPVQAQRLQNALLGTDLGNFEIRQRANFLVAFAYMFVPAVFMGVAFPLAGRIHAAYRRAVGGAVGEVLAYNTVGAILGAAVSGFALVYLLGIEHALQALAMLNLGFGLWVAAHARPGGAVLRRAAAAAAVLAIALPIAFPSRTKMWDSKHFAIYRNNQRGLFDTPERLRDAVDNTDVLYFDEGVNETISVIRPKGAAQALLVNGKVVASSTPQDVQCQYTLGHLPMLLHPDPRKVFVLGLGTGMTLGATSVHPEVEEIVLAELEHNVAPAARTFEKWNHGVLDDPKLRIVYNDGRNFLLTTRERFDVITADPVHPWTRGSAYLYTAEYYRLAASRLEPGGMMCQWLPIYELSVRDVRTVVETFGTAFRYVMVWLTQYDAELVGSDSPIVIDEAELARRMSRPEIRRDLASVDMGTARDFLSYFVAGTAGLREFGSDGVVNTDDNLYLEFSAPESVGVGDVMGANVEALAAHRESLLPYLAPAPSASGRAEQAALAARLLEAGRLYDRAHALYLWNRIRTDEFRAILDRLDSHYPLYGPGRFIRNEYDRSMAREPRLLEEARFSLREGAEGVRKLTVSAVVMRIGTTRASIVFVDNARREIWGELYVDGPGDELDPALERFAHEVLKELRARYRARLAAARAGGAAYPEAASTERELRQAVESRVAAKAVPVESLP